MEKKHASFERLGEAGTLFGRVSDVYASWALYHLDMLGNDETIGVERLFSGTVTQEQVAQWQRDVKKLKDETRKREREQHEVDLVALCEKK